MILQFLSILKDTSAKKSKCANCEKLENEIESVNKSLLECAIDAEITEQKLNKKIQDLKNKIINLQKNNIKTNRKLDRRNQKIIELEKQNEQLKKNNELLVENSLPGLNVCIFFVIFIFV